MSDTLIVPDVALALGGIGLQPHHRQQGQPPYLNQVTVNKHHTPQHTVPVQSGYLVGSAMGRNGLSPSSTASIYHFSQQNSQQVGRSLVIGVIFVYPRLLVFH